MSKPIKNSNGTWRMQVCKNGIRRSFTADTKSACEQMANAWKYSENNAHKSKRSGTVYDAVSKYIELSETLSPTTLSAYKRIRDYAFPELMQAQISALSAEIVQSAINNESKRRNERTGKILSAKTVKNEWALVSSALKQHNLTFNIKLPKVQHKNSDLPEPELIINAIKGSSVELPCLLAMWCGLRMSEIRGLKFTDLSGNILAINRVMVDASSLTVEKSLAKTDSSIRKVRVPARIIELIKDNGTDYIVPMTRSKIYHAYTRLMEASGLDISFHDLRHVFASVMLTKLNVPEKIVQDSGGWSTPNVMKSVYSQTFSSSRSDADDMRDEYFNSLITHDISKSAKKVQMDRKKIKNKDKKGTKWNNKK